MYLLTVFKAHRESFCVTITLAGILIPSICLSRFIKDVNWVNVTVASFYRKEHSRLIGVNSAANERCYTSTVCINLLSAVAVRLFLKDVLFCAVEP